MAGQVQRANGRTSSILEKRPRPVAHPTLLVGDTQDSGAMAEKARAEIIADTVFPPERLGAAELSDLAAVMRGLQAADEQTKAAINAVAEARGAYRFVWGKLQERYGFTDADGVSLEDGMIQRAPRA